MDRNKKLNYFLTYSSLFIVYLAFYFSMSAGLVSRYNKGIIISIMINIILATSLNLTVGCLGQITLGHAGFMSVGAYTAALLTKYIFHAGTHYYILALIFGGLVSSLVGIVIAFPTLRLKGDYLAITTLAFGEIIRVLIEYFHFTGGAQGLNGITRYNNFTLIYVIMVFSVIAMVSLMLSRHGRAVLAIREDEIAAEASGVNTLYYKTLAFTISAFFAGVAGGIYAHNIGVLGAKQFDYNYSINILVMVVLGGMGSFTGAIISAIVLSLLPEVLRTFSEYRMIIYPLVLILMMLFRPTGLLGTKEFTFNKIRKFIHTRGKNGKNK